MTIAGYEGVTEGEDASPEPLVMVAVEPCTDPRRGRPRPRTGGSVYRRMLSEMEEQKANDQGRCVSRVVSGAEMAGKSPAITGDLGR
jgi:hypothetical protein